MYYFIASVFVCTLSLCAEQTAEKPPHVILADESDGPDAGNWYEKIKWWKEAKLLYVVDIQTAMEQFDEIAQTYEDKERALMPVLETFAQSLPIKPGEAISFLDRLIDETQTRIDESARRQMQRGTIKETTGLEEELKLLKQFRDECKEYTTMVSRLRQVFDTIVVKQINDARSYEERALTSYEAIEKTLDHKKAEHLYNTVQNSLDNIQAISTYLDSSLMNFVNQAWTYLEKSMVTLKKHSTQLEEKGIVLNPAKVHNEQQELEKKKAAKKAAQKAQKKTERWWVQLLERIKAFFLSIWSYLKKPFMWLRNKLG